MREVMIHFLQLMPMLLRYGFRSLHRQLLHGKDANAHPCMGYLRLQDCLHLQDILHL